MFTDVHLLAANFCTEEQARYAFDKVKLTKNGKAIVTDGAWAVIVGNLSGGRFQDEKQDIYIERKDAERILGILEPTEKVGEHPRIEFAIREIENGEKNEIVQPQHGLKIQMKTDERCKFPDVEEAIENVNPKKKDGCKSAYVSIDRLASIIAYLQKMVKEQSSMKMFFGGKLGQQDAALRIEAKGKNDEEIVVTLMQMQEYA